MRVVVPPLAVMLGVAAVFVFFNRSAESDVERDADLCPVDASSITGSAVFLADFRKPLPASDADLPGELLRRVTLDLGKDAELRVFSLADSPSAPRERLQRLCKPYDDAELQVSQAKDQPGAARDCDDLPAQLAHHVREQAIRFCASRAALAQRLHALAERPWPAGRSVASAYLVEAIEDSRLELAERPGPHVIYVLSDMMQHAPWYSHLDLDWTEWRYARFSGLFDSQRWAFEPPAGGDMRIDVFYLPRRDLTDGPRARELHQRFWRDYFAGVRTVFHNQPPMPGYAAQPLMNVPGDAELAARERARAEALLRQVRQERDDIEREQRALAAERRQQAEQAREQALALLPLEDEPARREAEAEPQPAPQPRERLAAAEPTPATPTPADRRPEEETVFENGREQARVAREDGRAPGTATAVLERVVVPATDAFPPRAPDPSEPCALTLLPEFAQLLEAGRYPGQRRVNYGAATIAVDYLVDNGGATVDDAVAFLPERSTAADARHLDALVGDTLEVVRSWEFGFQDAPQVACARRQQRTAIFTYRKACRGAPIPSCQTLPGGIEFQ